MNIGEFIAWIAFLGRSFFWVFLGIIIYIFAFMPIFLLAKKLVNKLIEIKNRKRIR